MRKNLVLIITTLMLMGLLTACQNKDVGMVAGGVAGGVAGSALTGGSTAGTIVGGLGGAYVGRQLAN
ncbi:MAG TPA: glycine zipper 2TM domain-containing protein [Gammaproteobacteria bacterium]|jgi:osmotically inducible lipoprotein OsmB|nr:glycine zipper 2TM domain-containing protein [Gammaproteobacteria bacterium]